MYIVYGIPNCDTVKKTLSWLKANNISYEFHDYKKKGTTREKLEQWLQEYDWEKLVNTKGTTWRQLSDAEKPNDKESAIQLMLAKTSVIRRPIIEKGTIAAIGYDEAALSKLV